MKDFKMSKRIKFGDVVEFQVDEGFAYALYTHKNASYGNVLRVYNETFNEECLNFNFFSINEPSFTVFFPLQAAVDMGVVSIVSNIEVPSLLKVFPVFKQPKNFNFSPYEVYDWVIWDGGKTTYAGKLTDEIRQLPELRIANDTFIIDKIRANGSNDEEP